MRARKDRYEREQVRVTGYSSGRGSKRRIWGDVKRNARKDFPEEWQENGPGNIFHREGSGHIEQGSGRGCYKDDV